MQKTKFSITTKNLLWPMRHYFIGSWRSKSLILLSLLSGFYITNNSISFFIENSINSVFIVLLIVLVMELSIRLRHNNRKNNNINTFILLFIDNLRIGSTYALILEAFKLGS